VVPITSSFVSDEAEAERAEKEKSFTTWRFVVRGRGADERHAGISQSRGNSRQHELDYIMLYKPNTINQK
jgi:hypothetical protein